MEANTLDPEPVITFGKHKGKTFASVYESDPGYVNWVLTIEQPQGNMLDFSNFIKKKMCKVSTLDLKKTDDAWSGFAMKTGILPRIYQETTTPKAPTLESTLYSRSILYSQAKSEVNPKRQKTQQDPTPGDMSVFLDEDFEAEMAKQSPSLKYMMDKIKEEIVGAAPDSVVFEGALALVLFSEDEFYLSHSKLADNTGWWKSYVPSELEPGLARLPVKYETRFVGKERFLIYKATEYDKVLKTLRAMVKDKGAIEGIPNFVLRTFPNFATYAKEVTLEERTRKILHGLQDDYTRRNLPRVQQLVGDALWEKLFPFQRDGVLFGLKKNGRVLIGDEMGLGKSLQALAISAFYHQDWPMLIICPSSLRFQWKDQCLNWLPHLVTEDDIFLVKTSKQFSPGGSSRPRPENRPCPEGPSMSDREGSYFASGTLDAGTYSGAFHSAQFGPTNKIVITSYDLLVRAEQVGSFKSVICDESHYLKNRSTKRTKKIAPILRDAARVILLSGTPELNLPTELYEQVSSIIPGFSSNGVFNERYCRKRLNPFSNRMEFADSKHTQELHLFLKRTVMIRRLKNDVMSELPPKIRSKIPIEIPDYFVQETRKRLGAYAKAEVAPPADGDAGEEAGKRAGDKSLPQSHLDGFLGIKGMADRPGAEGSDKDPLRDFSNFIKSENDGPTRSGITELFFKTGQMKAQGVCKYVEELLEGSEKFIIFAHHTFMLDEIESTLVRRKVRYIRIDGSTKVDERARLVQQFQESGSSQGDANPSGPRGLKQFDCTGKAGSTSVVRVALLSLTACGVGLNLTASSTVIFAELYWVPGVLQQAEDRVHRIGTKFSTININYLIAQNSIDELVWKVINRKYKSLTSTLNGATSNLVVSTLGKKK